jgi:hypothetical protein
MARVPLTRNSTGQFARVAQLVAGSNVTISESLTGEVLTVTVAASGGGGGGGTPASSVVSETTFGLSPVVGTSTDYARGDHSHGSPTIPLASSVVSETAFGQSSAVGTSTNVARQDHTHGTPTIPLASTVVSETAYGQSSAVGTSSDVARSDHTHGTPAAQISGSFLDSLFGDASDGDVTISAFTTLSREMHYNNLTVTATGQLKPNGNRIFVRGTLTIAAGGSIDDNGFSATNQVGRTGFVARNYLGGQGTNGGSGWSIVAVNQATGLNAIDNTNCSLNATNTAPVGGNGGNSLTRNGGQRGLAPQNAIPQKWSGRILDGRGSFGAFNGSGGGGGGGITVSVYTSGTFISGGGGSGAGIVWIAAATVANSGNISANGGNGANASLGVGTGSCGGGGGGGGGLVAIITRSTTIGGTVSAAAGTGGTGAGIGGTNGANGVDGQYVLMVVK